MDGRGECEEAMRRPQAASGLHSCTLRQATTTPCHDDLQQSKEEGQADDEDEDEDEDKDEDKNEDKSEGEIPTVAHGNKDPPSTPRQNPLIPS